MFSILPKHYVVYTCHNAILTLFIDSKGIPAGSLPATDYASMIGFLSLSNKLNLSHFRLKRITNEGTLESDHLFKDAKSVIKSVFNDLDMDLPDKLYSRRY